jgi:hypothetical protein
MPNAVPALQPSELVLGRYRPLRPLGTGGSGSVWLARDEQTALDVALKIVPREGKAAARAEREAAAAARLRHPSCLRAYAFRRDARHVYIAYEYVPGPTFREAMRAGELTDARAIEACAQVCDGLAHAHAAGILHRDVKPSNVLLAEGRDEAVSARLLDFGLARMTDDETLTARGDVPGTLAYISPERLAAEPASEAADVWAVGVMLWEALAGRHPFWSGSMLETARAIEVGAPSLRELRPDLPKPLVAAVDSALALDPRRRPTARDLAGTLRGVAVARARRRGRRRPALSAPALSLRPPSLLRVLEPLLALPAPSLPRPSRREAFVPGVLERPGGRAVAGGALAAVFAGWAARTLPFFPGGWWLGLALLAAAAALVRPRHGLAIALAVPILPLGNVSLGLAILYSVVAAGWLALAWGEPEWGLVAGVGLLLGPLSALGLLPLCCLPIRSPLRRAFQAGAGVVLAGVAAGLRGSPLPFTGVRPPLGLGVAAADGPLDVAGSLLHALTTQHALAVEALALAAVAAVLPLVAARGRWGRVGAAGLLLAATVLSVPGAAALPLVLAAWATWGALAVVARRRPERAPALAPEAAAAVGSGSVPDLVPD